MRGFDWQWYNSRFRLLKDSPLSVLAERVLMRMTVSSIVAFYSAPNFSADFQSCRENAEVMDFPSAHVSLERPLIVLHVK